MLQKLQLEDAKECDENQVLWRTEESPAENAHYMGGIQRDSECRPLFERSLHCCGMLQRDQRPVRESLIAFDWPESADGIAAERLFRVLF